MSTTEDGSRAVAGRVPRRRRLVGRVSAGHVVMITAALLAMVLNYSVLRARDDTVRIAVAAEEVPAGVPVAPDQFSFVPVRLDQDLEARMLSPRDLPDVEGHIASAVIPAGAPVRRSDLRAPSAPQEQRAMSVPIEPEHAVGGALVPGDRVDVIEVRDGEARYLLTDGEVLAVPEREPIGGGIAALNTFNVTLAVDDETALALAAGIREGAIEIVRSTGARQADPARGATAP